MNWRDHAACKNARHLEWFPSATSAGGVTAAYRANLAACRAVCASCAVRAECLTSAVANQEAGIWAGLTARQRESLPGRSRKVLLCGSDGAYRRHLRAGEPPCDDCRAAHRLAKTTGREGRRFRVDGPASLPGGYQEATG